MTMEIHLRYFLKLFRRKSIYFVQPIYVTDFLSTFHSQNNICFQKKLVCQNNICFRKKLVCTTPCTMLQWSSLNCVHRYYRQLTYLLGLVTHNYRFRHVSCRKQVYIIVLTDRPTDCLSSSSTFHSSLIHSSIYVCMHPLSLRSTLNVCCLLDFFDMMVKLDNGGQQFFLSIWGIIVCYDDDGYMVNSRGFLFSKHKRFYSINTIVLN